MKYRTMTIDFDGMHVELQTSGRIIAMRPDARESISLDVADWRCLLSCMMLAQWVEPIMLVKEESQLFCPRCDGLIVDGLCPSCSPTP